MNLEFKPKGYNSVSPYFVVNGANKLIDLLIKIFDAEVLRKYDMPDGKIMHAEIKIDDSVLMFGDSSDKFPPNKLLTHIYVPDVDKVFQKAIDLGCEPIEEPKERDGDPDRRGAFKDFAGNIWSIATQINKEK
ncbi:putative glyoxalase superfamily protein PhnB [Thermoflavifilum aggregans]|uniref:Putative glyoxalase superfamily protein PhnB n=1 Tax=Thermoflavifilum aggregans TaxID=454188 RepID=A0A2M9CSB7_9BACT|nr:VOC family protein [Thermoflavifilum aggregans]PJJ74804.1 putative glyoxalase superfamily protein PhnB [Thermoflavifilum aggregans]